MPAPPPAAENIFGEAGTVTAPAPTVTFESNIFFTTLSPCTPFCRRNSITRRYARPRICGTLRSKILHILRTRIDKLFSYFEACNRS